MTTTRNFVFRVDSSSEIGHGHIMRCLVLAEELRRLGMSVHFICRNHSGSVHDRVREAGHVLHLLEGKEVDEKSQSPEDWLGVAQAEDADACRRILGALSPSQVIVDHYGIDIEWECRVSCEGLTIIDDLANRRHQCSRMIDQSLIHAKEDYLALIDGSFEFWGGASILLREEFRRASGWSDACAGSVLLCMGGADPAGVTVRLARGLVHGFDHSRGRPHLRRLDVVVGQAFGSQAELEDCLAAAPFAVAIHRSPPLVSSLMAAADVSILSCGTMILEACALGAPAIGIPLADNQKPTARFLEERQAILEPGAWQEEEEGVSSLLADLLSDRGRRAQLSQAARSMVDKDSASKIARALANEH